jgi:hypothetical protein
MTAKIRFKALTSVIGILFITVLLIAPAAGKGFANRDAYKNRRAVPSKMLHAPATPHKPFEPHQEPWVKYIIGSTISIASRLAG